MTYALALQTSATTTQSSTAPAAEHKMTVEALRTHTGRNTPLGTFDDVAEQPAAMAGAGTRRFDIRRSPYLDRTDTSVSFTF